MHALHGERLENIISIDDNYIVAIRCSTSTILQPSEIKKVKVNLLMEIEEGYVLSFFPSTFLVNQNISLFPSPFIIDSTYTGEVSLPLHNCGNNQVNLNRGHILAYGYLSKVAKVKITEHEFTEKTFVKTPSRSKRKDKDISFEVK